MILLDTPDVKKIIDITNNFVMLDQTRMYHIPPFDIENSEVVLDYAKHNPRNGHIFNSFTSLRFNNIIVAVLVNKNAIWLKNVLQDEIRERTEDSTAYISKLTVLGSFYLVMELNYFTFDPSDIPNQMSEAESPLDYHLDKDLYDDLYDEYGDSLDKTPYKVTVEYEHDVAMLTTKAFVEAIFKNLKSV